MKSVLKGNGVSKSYRFHDQTVHALLYTTAAHLIGRIVLTAHKNSCLKDVSDSNSSCKHVGVMYFLVRFHAHSKKFVLAHESLPLLPKRKKSQSVKRHALSSTTLSLSLPVNILNQTQDSSVFCNNADCSQMFSSQSKCVSAFLTQFFTQRKSVNI